MSVGIAGAMATAPAFAQPPTFARDIAPLVYEKCAACHRPGSTAPFSLLTYDDVKKRASQIAAATRAGYMPPYLPEPGYGDFAGDPRLTQDQIATIAAWASNGAPEGAVTDIPPPPSFPEGWQLGKPDLVLEAGSSFQLPAAGPDLYWNVIFTPECDDAPMGARYRDSSRPAAPGASCQPAGGPRWIGAPARIVARQGISGHGPGNRP